jgi:hypothetical protein
MKRSLIMMGCAAWLVCLGRADAQRCIGPMDNSSVAANAGCPSTNLNCGQGVPAISAADITWCDDFDTYCDNNCGDACDPTWPAHSAWPGYPPTPDNLCTAGTDPAGGANDPSGSYFRQSYHWPQYPITNPLGMSSSNPSLGGDAWKGWDSNTGWITGPYTMEYQGGGNTNQYHTFNLGAAAWRKFPGADALNGTDASPLTLRFWANPVEAMSPVGVVDSPPILPMYVELRMDSDHAPTDYVLSKKELNTAWKACEDNGVGPFPVISQQRHRTTGLPALSTQVHASLAFGWLPMLDLNPCDVETGRKPTNYHAAIFDGLKWTQLYASMFAGQVDKFNWDTGQAYFEMKVKTATVEIKQIAYVQTLICDNGDCTEYHKEYRLKKSTATVPRQYLGAFNRVSIGVAPGCELDANGNCVTQPDVYRYMQNGHGAWGWNRDFVDRVALLGGVGFATSGACCLPTGTCEVKTFADCTAAGGTFRGSGTVCDSQVCLGACCQGHGVCTQTLVTGCVGNYRGAGTSCNTLHICPCPTPFADQDMDGDVDMEDFAGLQRCLNLGGGSLQAGCECFDKNASGGIDADDVEKFTLCATGEGIAWAPTAACP